MTARRLIAAVALFLALAGAARADSPVFDPAKTYVFVASIVQWPAEAGLASFGDERKDYALVGALNAAGVDSKNITFLVDDKATLAAMRKELRALATRAGEGSTIVFSFQGHGDRHGGKTYFMNYDVKDDVEKTSFCVDEIASILDECWKGERLLLLGDCCHSGALAEVVAHYEKSRVKAACFTSATASNRSTEHWTFTEAFIEALQGDGRIDRDHDGTITFEETDRWIHEAMKYREGQLTHATRTASFETSFGIHKTSKAVADVPGDVEIGDFVEALDREQKWYVAQVESYADGQYGVHYLGWERKWDEKLGKDRIRSPQGKPLDVGGIYEVEWEEGQWFPGSVTRCEEGWFYFVHYEGELGDDDEWITAARARKPAPPEYAPVAPREVKKGEKGAACWRQQWFLAKVVGVEKNAYTVRYDDGSKGRVTKEQLIAVAEAAEIAVGERVLACWKKGDAHMYPGTVLKKGAKSCTIQWEDGSDPSEAPLGQIVRVKK